MAMSSGKRRTTYRTKKPAKRARKSSYEMAVTPRRRQTLNTQIRALIASKKKETADKVVTLTNMTATSISCPHSSTSVDTAASGTGLYDCDADEILVNHIRIKGTCSNTALLDVDPTGLSDVVLRKLVVWFNKPLVAPAAAGTLPAITEVLLTDVIGSMPVTDAANGGRFKILSDKLFYLGTNTFQAATAVGHARVNGKNQYFYDYTVEIGKRTKFAAPSNSGTLLGGHYDSDVAGGRVDKGLIVIYTQQSGGASGGTLNDSMNTRINYTG